MVHLLQLIHDDREMMNLLMYKMYARDIKAFANFVGFCEDNIHSWKGMLSSHAPPTLCEELPWGKCHGIDASLLQDPFTSGMSCEEKSNVIANSRSLKILVGSTQCPGVGGGATNAYKLTSFLRGLSGKVGVVFFEDLSFMPLSNYDPDNIGGVWRMPRFSSMEQLNNSPILRGQLRRDIRLARRTLDSFFGGPPDVILCKNFVSPACMKIIYPVDTPKLM